MRSRRPLGAPGYRHVRHSPPQSTPSSFPFRTPSSHEGAWQTRSLHTPDPQFSSGFQGVCEVRVTVAGDTSPINANSKLIYLTQ